MTIRGKIEEAAYLLDARRVLNGRIDGDGERLHGWWNKVMVAKPTGCNPWASGRDS